MIKRSLTLSMLSGLFLVNMILANDPRLEEEFDINSIDYIEEEPELELGFDTADYLPEGFDPYTTYFDLSAVEYLENDEIGEFDKSAFLPKGFNAYAYPSHVESINYIDLADMAPLTIDTSLYLPDGFDPFSRK